MFFFFFFFMNREEGWGNSCMPDQLALTAIVKFFFSPQLFLYGPLKGADASTLLPSVPSQEYSASLFFFYFSSLSQTVTWDAELLSEKSF